MRAIALTPLFRSGLLSACLLAACLLAAMLLVPPMARAQCLEVAAGTAWQDHPSIPSTVMLMQDGKPLYAVSFPFGPECSTDQGQTVAHTVGRPICVGDTLDVDGHACKVANIIDCSQSPGSCK